MSLKLLKVINDRLKILTFDGVLNKDAFNIIELDQQSVGRLSRMDAFFSKLWQK